MLNTNSFFICFLLIFFTSCTSGKYKDISTFTVSYKNFENSLTIEGFVEPVRTSVAICPRNIQGIITYLVEEGTYVNAGDIICNLEVQEIQTRYEEALIVLENSIAGFNKTKADLNLQYAILEAQVENNNANTKIAQLDSLQLIYSPTNIRKIKELELEKAAIQKEQFDKKLQALDIINQSEIRKWELQIQRISNRVKSLKEQLDALNIKAPKDGLAMIAINRATGLKNQIGDMVWGNAVLVTIPELTEMKVNIKATETEYKYINVNDSIVFTFDAMPGNKAWGRILSKSHIGAPFKRGSKVKVFDIEASIDSVISMPSPGFTVNCNVIMKEIKNSLVIPQVAVFEEDSIKVVYVKNKKGFEMRQILTGLSSSKEVIITSGLEENEIISLTKPISSIINKMVILTNEV